MGSFLRVEEGKLWWFKESGRGVMLECSVG